MLEKDTQTSVNLYMNFRRFVKILSGDPCVLMNTVWYPMRDSLGDLEELYTFYPYCAV